MEERQSKQTLEIEDKMKNLAFQFDSNKKISAIYADSRNSHVEGEAYITHQVEDNNSNIFSMSYDKKSENESKDVNEQVKESDFSQIMEEATPPLVTDKSSLNVTPKEPVRPAMTERNAVENGSDLRVRFGPSAFKSVDLTSRHESKL